jgi:hypothetical protein
MDSIGEESFRTLWRPGPFNFLNPFGVPILPSDPWVPCFDAPEGYGVFWYQTFVRTEPISSHRQSLISDQVENLPRRQLRCPQCPATSARSAGTFGQGSSPANDIMESDPSFLTTSIQAL